MTFKYETEPSKNKDTNTIHCCCRLTDNMILLGDHNNNLIQCKVEDGEITEMEKIKGKFLNNDICLLLMNVLPLIKIIDLSKFGN